MTDLLGLFSPIGPAIVAVCVAMLLGFRLKFLYDVGRVNAQKMRWQKESTMKTVDKRVLLLVITMALATMSYAADAETAAKKTSAKKPAEQPWKPYPSPAAMSQTQAYQRILQQPWGPPDPAAVSRWQDMRFGMFIHWGPVSLTAKEIGWSRGRETPIDQYDNLYKQFNPTKFDADHWVSLAKMAGMKYIVLTTKHHDGFCLWDTKLTDYNIMNSPFKRDVVKELATACKNKALPLAPITRRATGTILIFR